jgi:hypothetical protein
MTYTTVSFLVMTILALLSIYIYKLEKKYFLSEIKMSNKSFFRLKNLFEATKREDNKNNIVLIKKLIYAYIINYLIALLFIIHGFIRVIP